MTRLQHLIESDEEAIRVIDSWPPGTPMASLRAYYVIRLADLRRLT